MTEPRTKAGRALLAFLHRRTTHGNYRHTAEPEEIAQIEAEAAASLDVERLARAFDLNGVNWPKRWGDNDFAWLARQVAAEYNRLATTPVSDDTEGAG